MSENRSEIVAGVDTHRDVHVAAAVDGAGRLVGTASFPTTSAGYGQLLAWLVSKGDVRCVGVEGTGSYGAGLARHLGAAGVAVVEVHRPNRQLRRRRGKSDTIDAEAAARATLNGDATAQPKSADGPVEAIRTLTVARRSAIKARTQAANQIHALVVTAPETLRNQLTGVPTKTLLEACARLRPHTATDPVARAAKMTLRILARRHRALNAEITDLDGELLTLCQAANPALLAAPGVGAEVAATLLITAGDNPDRMRTEASFAALCGASPLQASSGAIVRHRLNRGGDRAANNALWRIATVRLTCDARSIDYANKRQAQGKTRRDIIRCLKRHIAREIYHLLTNPPPVPNGADLRRRRHTANITLQQVADAIGAPTNRLSELERGTHHNHRLARHYETWLTQHTT